MNEPLDKNLSGYDLCIVGAGPAGLAIAAELAYRGLKICILESGTEKRSVYADALKEVESEGLPIKPNSRERVLGGASSTWGGLSALLDEVDLEQWPIQAAELAPYLAALGAYRFPHPEEFKDKKGELRLRSPLEEKTFVAVRPPYRFAVLRSIFNREGVDLYTDATVVQVVHNAGEVTQLLCKTSAGGTFEVRAKTFVLAAGGIENPRLLLVSDIGKELPVGRYFMNHPKGYAGLLHLSEPLSAKSSYLNQVNGSRIMYAGLRLSPDYQQEKGLGNSYVGLEAHLPHLFARAWYKLTRHTHTVRLRWFSDMEPQKENRVLLSERRDAFGVPLPL